MVRKILDPSLFYTIILKIKATKVSSFRKKNSPVM